MRTSRRLPQMSTCDLGILLTVCLFLLHGTVTADVMNAVQLGVRTLLDNIIPGLDTSIPNAALSIDMPSIRVTTGTTGQLIALGCPKCQNINAEELTGLWHQIYANDNFIRNHLLRLAQLSGNTQGHSKNNRLGRLMKLLMEPARMPVCIRFDVGEPVDYGFAKDFPMLVSFHEGVPRGRLVQIIGRLRYTMSNGQLVFMVGTGKSQYRLRFCVISSNLRQPINSLIVNDGESFGPVRVTRQSTGSGLRARHTGFRATDRREGADVARRQSEAVIRRASKLFYKNQLLQPKSPTLKVADRPQDTLVTMKPVTTAVRVPQHADNIANRSSTQAPQVITTPDPTTTTPDPFPLFPGNPETPFATASKFMVITDLSDLPSCQNYAVLSNDRSGFFNQWDLPVLQLLTGLRANTDVNPIHYTGCPTRFSS